MRACFFIEQMRITRRHDTTKYGPSFQHVRSPIRFYRAHSVSTQSGGNEGRLRGCSLGHSEVAVEGLAHQPAADHAAEVGIVAAVLVVVPVVVGYSVVKFV